MADTLIGQNGPAVIVRHFRQSVKDFVTVRRHSWEENTVKVIPQNTSHVIQKNATNHVRLGQSSKSASIAKILVLI